MAWIRLDDQIAHHPKILKCSSSACWLYVTCISYAQRMLTDGHVADNSVALLSHVRRPLECMDELVKAGLLERVADGYQIHDYLDFNESAASVKTRREQDRKRKASGRNPSGIQAESGRIPSDPSRARASHPIPSHPRVVSNNKQSRKNSAGSIALLAASTTRGSNGNGNGRSKHPIFSGQRFTVFDWQLEDLSRILGPHTEAFDLHAFFFTLDAEMLKSPEIIPQRDGGQWLQRRVLTEAKQRGLQVASTEKLLAPELSKETIEAMIQKTREEDARARAAGYEPL